MMFPIMNLRRPSLDLGLPDKAGQALLSGSSLHPVTKESDKTFKTPQH